MRGTGRRLFFNMLYGRTSEILNIKAVLVPTNTIYHVRSSSGIYIGIIEGVNGDMDPYLHSGCPIYLPHSSPIFRNVAGSSSM